MNLIFGYLAMGLVMITTMFANHEPEAKAKPANQAAVENSSRLESGSASSPIFASEPKPGQETPKSLDQWPMECEGAAARLDFAVINTQKLEGAYLILIARLGSGEVSRRLNQIRLANAKEYVLRRGSDLKYVLAEGSRVKGLGRIEIYVGGKLTEIMPLKRNAKGYCFPGRNGG